MLPPKGFKSQLLPLEHKLNFGFGLSVATGTMNSTICSLVRNYKDATNDPTTIIVNPHNAGFETETGGVCGPMSIIDKLNLSISFALTKDFLSASFGYVLKFSWMPIFLSFPEKLDAVDDKTSTTVASILNLTKDATKEDVTPTFSTNLDSTPPSDAFHPLSSANITETAAILNLTTDTIMESVAWNATTFFNALKYYTNKGALKACLGKTRNVTLSANHNHVQFNLRKFVPRAIRRIVPYSFFGILIHLPIATDPEQYFVSSAAAASGSDLGVKIMCRYHEWNPDHIQDMT